MLPGIVFPWLPLSLCRLLGPFQNERRSVLIPMLPCIFFILRLSICMMVQAPIYLCLFFARLPFQSRSRSLWPPWDHRDYLLLLTNADTMVSSACCVSGTALFRLASLLISGSTAIMYNMQAATHPWLSPESVSRIPFSFPLSMSIGRFTRSAFVMCMMFNALSCKTDLYIYKTDLIKSLILSSR